MIAVIKANLPAKTGKTFREWVQIARGSRPHGMKECVQRLKQEHGLGTNTACIIAMEACEQGGSTIYENTEALVDGMYAGPKAGLRPIYEALAKAVKKLGKDAELTPCMTYVGVRRNRQFALIKPTTPTRVDLGLALEDAKPQGRLELAKSLDNGRITRVIRIRSPREVDADVRRWLKAAYDLAC
jgi:predicted transport protein